MSLDLIGLDFETYGATDLFSRGLDNYTTCPTFKPLLAGLAWGDQGPVTDILDLTDPDAKEILAGHLEDRIIVAHNAGFEKRVLDTMGISIPSDRFIDSAVVARAAGAAGKLEAAAPQLLGSDKMEEGKDLIKLFSIPGSYQEKSCSPFFDEQVILDHPKEWVTFKEYCEKDALLGLELALDFQTHANKERGFNAITMDMNSRGWKVDLDSVEEMQRRYLENLEEIEYNFRANHDAEELNLNSLKQLKEWCLDRGIRATSFDEKNVKKMVASISRKLESMSSKDSKFDGYNEVLEMLKVKQELGGSSLTKLQKILDLTGPDGRLRDQYLHLGAGQSFRTTGKGVQMQNLKRLSEPADMELLMDPATEWSNDQLAENIRQCFTASDPAGALIVGDFSSVESRGLAWLAGATWKLQAFFEGRDMYKVQASTMFGTPYEQVTKAQRTPGKVAELSCGYQASGPAVKSFAEGMGVELSEGEASDLVQNWRATNPEIVTFWGELDKLLNAALDSPDKVHMFRVGPNRNYWVEVEAHEPPDSLAKLNRRAKTIVVKLLIEGQVILERTFHGCYRRGKSICYYKPSTLKTGDLWSPMFRDPKTKQMRFYSIYGGKLAGILTQSLCREIFFNALEKAGRVYKQFENVQLVGQFHDEIVLDWSPGELSLAGAVGTLENIMSTQTLFEGFPLAAEVKHDYRYTK